MKKLTKFLTVAVLIAGTGSFSTHAQEYPSNEISLSYGIVTVPQTAVVMGSILGTAFSLGIWNVDEFHFMGQFSLEYYHGLSKTWSIGCIGSFDNMFGDAYERVDDMILDSGRFGASFISLMPAAKAAWFRHPKFAMYSKLAIGATVCVMPEDELSDKSADLGWMFQIAPVGAEFGGGRWRGFIEAGWGAQGILNGGIRRCF